MTVGYSVADEVKLVKYNFDDQKRFPKALPTVELCHLTDLQIGSKGFLRRRFREYANWILAKPNRFALLGGDLGNFNTVLSVGSPYDDEAEPRAQIKMVLDELRALTDAGRILGSVGGNHERRTVKTYGDAGAEIAERLGIPYSSGTLLIDLRYGEHKPFKIALWHGAGSARTKGAAAQTLHRFIQRTDSHVSFMGHLHQAMVLPDYKQVRAGDTIKRQKVFGILSSSFQEYWNSYAEAAGFAPFDVMMGRVILEPNGKWEVTLR
jgi:hypothetical protein